MAESWIAAGLEATLTVRVETGMKELSLQQRNLDYNTGRQVEIKSTTAQIGAREIRGHDTCGITDGSHGSLSLPKADEGLMDNLNSPLFGHSQPQVEPVNFHSLTPVFTNRRASDNDSEMGCDLNLSPAPSCPVCASNSQQPEKQDGFSKKEPIRRVRDKPKCKKMSAARKSNFSLARCINEFKKLPEFTESDMGHVVEIFSDEYYRKVFIAMDRACKVFFLRYKIDEAKEK